MATAARAIRYIAPDEEHHVRCLCALCQRRWPSQRAPDRPGCRSHGFWAALLRDLRSLNRGQPHHDLLRVATGQSDGARRRRPAQQDRDAQVVHFCARLSGCLKIIGADWNPHRGLARISAWIEPVA